MESLRSNELRCRRSVVSAPVGSGESMVPVVASGGEQSGGGQTVKLRRVFPHCRGVYTCSCRLDAWTASISWVSVEGREAYFVCLVCAL